jgi:hypothetical protein
MYFVNVNGERTEMSEQEHGARVEQLKRRMGNGIQLNLAYAQIGRKTQEEHIAKTRGVFGLLSDFINDVYPPYIGMWSLTVNQLERAQEFLEVDDIRNAQNWLKAGLESLADAQTKWRNYINASIEGADATVSTLRSVRDGAIAIEVGLLTGGAFYAAAGGGALAAAGATLAGASGATHAASSSESGLGEAARGTVEEIVDTGVVENLRLAAHGVAGIMYGTGEGLTAILTSMVAIPETLYTLFTDPRKVYEDLIVLGKTVEQLWTHRRELWSYFASLPPEQQAFQIGRLTGHLESMLITMQTANATGTALSEGFTKSSIGLAASSDGTAILQTTTRIIQINQEAATLGASGTAAAGIIGAFSMGVKSPNQKASVKNRARRGPGGDRGKKMVGTKRPVAEQEKFDALFHENKTSPDYSEEFVDVAIRNAKEVKGGGGEGSDIILNNGMHREVFAKWNPQSGRDIYKAIIEKNQFSESHQIFIEYHQGSVQKLAMEMNEVLKNIATRRWDFPAELLGKRVEIYRGGQLIWKGTFK